MKCSILVNLTEDKPKCRSSADLHDVTLTRDSQDVGNPQMKIDKRDVGVVYFHHSAYLRVIDTLLCICNATAQKL